jgi:excisionase family DNA binding protein
VRWLSTEEAADAVGMTSEWVRAQIQAKRLPAFVFATGRRRTYRIRLDHWQHFLSRYRRRTDDPGWE